MEPQESIQAYLSNPKCDSPEAGGSSRLVLSAAPKQTPLVDSPVNILKGKDVLAVLAPPILVVGNAFCKGQFEDCSL